MSDEPSRVEQEGEVPSSRAEPGEEVPHGDPRFFELREALASYAADPDDPPVHAYDSLQAAVAVVVRGSSELELLLIKRAHHEDDPWAGHMALPGGRRDPDDADLLHTAVRETREETDLDLESQGRHLGRLGLVAPQSVRLPRIAIHPFVFGVPSGAEASVASREVDAVHWVRLADLGDPASRDRVEIRVEGGVREFPCYRVAGEIVWGLTYRILTEFLEVYPESFG